MLVPNLHDCSPRIRKSEAIRNGAWRALCTQLRETTPGKNNHASENTDSQLPFSRSPAVLFCSLTTIVGKINQKFFLERSLWAGFPGSSDSFANTF